MKTITQCPVCEGGARRTWPALIAPFIAFLVLKAPVSPCSLVECAGCGLRFFDGRFNLGELAHLYQDYRGDSYYRIRHAFEPWYGVRHNQGTGHDPNVIAARKADLGAFLNRHQVAGVERVLDYGGDSGQFIPDGLGTIRHVFELSSALPVGGVTKINDENDLEPESYDLILLSHVLEHAPEPVTLLCKLQGLLKPGSGVLYVEVPHERYRLWCGTGRLQRRYLAWLSRHQTLLKLVDFLSTSCRVLLGTVPPLGFPKLHEHLNLFDATSLKVACERAGMVVEDASSATKPKGCVLSMLAKQKT